MVEAEIADSEGSYGIAATGSPLYSAVIGAADIRRSIEFYSGAMGLDVVERAVLSGAAFETHWRLPAGSTAEMAVLADRECAVGRISLLQFNARTRAPVRNVQGQRIFGFVNLNFYTDDIWSLTARREAAGCRRWSDPVVHDMGPTIGQPVEVMLDGPDTVILNLLQLQAPNPEARVLRTISYIKDSGGFNRCGTTPVVTSQHCVPRYAEAVAFNVAVLGMSVRNDTILQGADMEEFMQYPPGARSRDTYLQGTHVYGKVAINHPLNFECQDIVPRATAPNIGYIAQSFIVPSLEAALAAANELGADLYSPPVEIALPGLGWSTAAIVCSPGSGALHELIEMSAETPR
jgi:catechol 2,3-dioxygenase-like lactoylglutathione lyase family enzyme